MFLKTKKKVSLHDHSTEVKLKLITGYFSLSLSPHSLSFALQVGEFSFHFNILEYYQKYLLTEFKVNNTLIQCSIRLQLLFS